MEDALKNELLFLSSGEDGGDKLNPRTAEKILGSILIVSGVVFTFFGQKLEKTIFFLCGFFSGLGACLYFITFLRRKDLIDEPPDNVKLVVACGFGSLCGYVTKSLFLTAISLLGGCAGLLSSTFIWQLLSGWDFFLTYVGKAEWVRVSVIFGCAVTGAFVASRKVVYETFMILATAFVGGYIIAQGVNDLYKGIEGEYYSKRFVPGELLKNPQEIFHQADEEFWSLFALWFVNCCMGVIVQCQMSKRKQRELARREQGQALVIPGGQSATHGQDGISVPAPSGPQVINMPHSTDNPETMI